MFTVTTEQRGVLDCMESELRCPMCSNLLSDACTTRCEHHFCSSCLHDWLADSSECPTCSLPVSPGEVCKNPSLQQLVSHLQSMMKALRNIDLKRSSVAASTSSSSCSFPLFSQNQNVTVEQSQNQNDETVEDRNNRTETVEDTNRSETNDMTLSNEENTLEETLDHENEQEEDQREKQETRESVHVMEVNDDEGGEETQREEELFIIRGEDDNTHEQDQGEEIEEVPPTIDEDEDVDEEERETQVEADVKMIQSEERPEEEEEEENQKQEEQPPGTQAIDEAKEVLASCLKLHPGLAVLDNVEKEHHAGSKVVKEKKQTKTILVGSEIMKSMSDEEIRIVEEMGGKLRTELSEMEDTVSSHALVQTRRITTSAGDKLDEFTRTPKYILGLLQGAWIVVSDWLFDSIRAQAWLPEESYQVKTKGNLEIDYHLARSLGHPSPFENFNYILALKEADAFLLSRVEVELLLAFFRSKAKPKTEIRDLSYFVDKKNFVGVQTLLSQPEIAKRELKARDVTPFQDPKKLVVIIANHEKAKDDDKHWHNCEECGRLFILVQMFPNSIVVDCSWLHRLPFSLGESKKQFKPCFFAPSHASKLVGDAVSAEFRAKYKLFDSTKKKSKKDKRSSSSSFSSKSRK